MKELSRAAIESVAAMLGKNSGAARVLADADAHDGPVQFFQHKNQILLKKLPRTPYLALN